MPITVSLSRPLQQKGKILNKKYIQLYTKKLTFREN